ncbi:MAG: hypothetical protein SFY56_04765 [Bacteroidota bacterium]|nr:hypothetical protein [Bacteroidota bacterium]
MASIFEIVYKFLVWLSNVTGLTYREINIIVYYMIIPLFYFRLIDKLVGKHYFKIGFIIFWIIAIILIPNFEKFSFTFFDYSVVFLNWFDVIGWNYTVASVIICVFLPIIIYLVLLYLLRKKQKKNFLWFKFI